MEMNNILQAIHNWLKRIFSMGEDMAPAKDTIATIADGVEFRGVKLWILILAIFVASLGLNTNSAAVIIGAMLISPLMGPIIGMGLGVGINDFTLLKRAAKNYLIATLFSVATATLYFLITPLDEVQSELLARTSPGYPFSKEEKTLLQDYFSSKPQFIRMQIVFGIDPSVNSHQMTLLMIVSKD